MINQETLATGLLFLTFFGCGIALVYIWNLIKFFEELKDREPKVWESIGKPSLFNMLFLPFINFRKFYAFLPTLKARRNSDYQYARKAYRMLNVGLVFFVLLIINVFALIFSFN